MFVKTLCLVLVLAVVAYGLPYGKYDDGNIDPGFGRYPNQGGFAPDAGFGNGHGQGGLPSQGGFAPDAGFGNGNGQGGLPSPSELIEIYNQLYNNYKGAGGSHTRNHQYGYQQYGY